MTEQVIDIVAFNSMKKMVGEEYIAELLETYFEDTPQQIAVLHQALARGDAPSFQRAAHSIKSNSLSFGAAGLASQARELEYLGRDRQLDGATTKVDQLEAAYQRVHQALSELT